MVILIDCVHVCICSLSFAEYFFSGEYLLDQHLQHVAAGAEELLQIWENPGHFAEDHLAILVTLEIDLFCISPL